jgi:Flp pilus assembly protein TadG
MRDEGLVAVSFALFLPVALILLSLVMDVAWISIVRTQLQIAVDFGALAAVQDLDLELLANGRCELLVDSATATALAYAWENLETGIASGNLSTCQVSCDVYNPGNHGFHGPPYTVQYPIVCMHASISLRSPITSLARTVTAHADASLMPRP